MNISRRIHKKLITLVASIGTETGTVFDGVTDTQKQVVKHTEFIFLMY